MKPSLIALFICSTSVISFTNGQVVDLMAASVGQRFTTGLFWDYLRNVLFFVDRVLSEIHRVDPIQEIDQMISLDGDPTFVIPTKDYDRRFIINEDNKLIYLFWPYDFVGGYYAECLITTVDCQCPGNDLNDGKADACGRIWAATKPAQDSKGNYSLNQASLYSFDTRTPGKVRVTPALRPISFGNDLTWTRDNNIFYFSESDSRCIYSFKYDLVNGIICCGQTVFCFSDFNITGVPDGLTIDWNDDLWIAANGAGLVLNVNPNTKKLIRTVSIPALDVSDVEFGGRQLNTLFVSTRNSGRPSEPLAGSIFVVTGLNVFGIQNHYAVMNSDCTPEFFK